MVPIDGGVPTSLKRRTWYGFLGSTTSSLLGFAVVTVGLSRTEVPPVFFSPSCIVAAEVPLNTRILCLLPSTPLTPTTGPAPRAREPANEGRRALGSGDAPESAGTDWKPCTAAQATSTRSVRRANIFRSFRFSHQHKRARVAEFLVKI